MLYLEDYLELIEHLPQELRDRLTLIRENDLIVNNSSHQIDTKVKQFFADAKNQNPDQRQCNYNDILKDYEKAFKNADAKLQIADQTSEIMVKLIQRLDGELEKFKLELEADHAGITEKLERRSLELDADMDDAINSFMNSSSSSRHSINLKDRRRSEFKQRHQPYQQKNGYRVRAKLAQNHHDHNGIYNTSQNKQMPHPNHYQNRLVNGRYIHSNNVSRQNSTTTSPAPYGPSSVSGPSSISGDHSIMNGLDMDDGGHYNNNLTSFANKSGFKSSFKNNLPYSQQHSALSAALSSATLPNTASISSPSVYSNKISNNSISLKGSNLVDGSSPSLVKQNPLAAAASQAIAATQQLHQGRRTPSLKASFAAINAAGLNQQADNLGYTNRNALATMAPDQQAHRYSQQYGKLNSNGNSSPAYVPVTKSGRPSKRPKNHASHLYPDESPASISSDNSVFENSESLSSADFMHETSPTFGSSSPQSYDYSRSHMSDQGGGEYQYDQTKYCICRQVSYGGMVACDNEDCEIQWFHFGCVDLTEAPSGKWFCPECKMSMGSQLNRNQAQSQQKKRGRKEKSTFNSMDSNSHDAIHTKSKDRAVSVE